MTIRHKIYCINCGKEIQKVSINSEEEKLLKIKCLACGIITTITNFFDEKASDLRIEIEDLTPEEYIIKWKQLTNNSKPIFICPFCGDKKLKEIITKDGGENFFECKKCDRYFEIEYA